ncbi:MAG: Nif3-like dinuclear metal center hexameric protein [Gemmatimonadota bacterium]
MPQLESEFLFRYIDEYLGVAGFPDYPGAMNGLQVEGAAQVQRLAAAVDVSEASIAAAAEEGADLLLVHHGLFWGGAAPLTGRRFRKVAALIRNELALYSAHLPLDAHPEIGNCAVLARELGFEPVERFGTFEAHDIGFVVGTDEPIHGLRKRMAEVLGGPVQLLPGGPERASRVGIVTGGGGSFLELAAEGGLDTLITGEVNHHAYVEAIELGMNVLLGGHYLTEVWGVRALASHLEQKFGIPWVFLDLPSGL